VEGEQVEMVSSSRGRPPLPEGPFLVAGLARSGVAVARALRFRGQQVTGVDSASPTGLELLDLAGVPYFLESDGTGFLDGIRTVVKSPGIPQDAPLVTAARERGIPVFGELEIGWRLVEGSFLAITGTNGKTTTTELAAHLFREAGRPVEVAGNVGSPLSGLVEEPAEPDRTVVCECSSFQLEDTSDFAPECAVFLNLAPDHLDRYPDFDSYGKAKLEIFARQEQGDVAVVNVDDPWLSSHEVPGGASRVGFLAADREGRQADIWLESGEMIVDGEPLLALSDLKLFGRHNVANAMAAAAAALSLGLSREAVARGLASFAGVPHRLESVAEVEGVLWVNDSKGTNVTATLTALDAFDRPVRPILGGSGKGEDFGPLAEAVAGSCPAVYLIGEAAKPIGTSIRDLDRPGTVVIECGDLEGAVARAAADAAPGDVVLLSPACASFDQFRDYEERGDRFRTLVGGLDV
jgi:UDP-N-acetylmuramoylalanine--D-glutamate ligase